MKTRYDYTHSGPPWFTRFLMRFVRMQVACDGINCGTRLRVKGKQVHAEKAHRPGGWVHKADLDFCPRCQRDGKMDEAITAGVRPRGAE
jgi:hypothetical protein